MEQGILRSSQRCCALTERLPGEIRNHIFGICLQHTFINGVSNVTISAFPRWSGPGVMRLAGLGPLSLLFTNKQIHSELLSLVYSQVDQVVIGGYIIQHPDEDPNARWQIAYSMLDKQPLIMKLAESVKIHMPCLRLDLHRGFCQSLSFQAPKQSAKTYNMWAVVPGLERYLRKLPKLSAIVIVITVEEGPAPDFGGLLPLYDICGRRTAVNFIMHQGLWAASKSVWSSAWDNCLQDNGRLDGLND
ncbi:hypothetical protein BJ875DRAFT_40312 [Amylocarpus encephaloides]|uniref:Uncharacterized protein n=1 Tax=Amylocarpus encephaloides TaxID=45428 RepID=A0A9P7YRQ0_9HELO|nr:hypothetical protein BJ875DRAFT_40312 [Amylocarpus encephaloides]